MKFGILNKDNLLSALSIQDNNYYENDYLMLSALLRSLVLAHGFQQGNKRTAFLAIITANMPNCEPLQLSDIILQIAKGELTDINRICDLIYNVENKQESLSIHDIELDDCALQA